MKYRVLLKFLRLLVYIKRSFWWVGNKLGWAAAGIVRGAAKVWVYVAYRASAVAKRVGLPQRWLLKRGFLQLGIFAILFVGSITQTALFPSKNLAFAGQKTIAYDLLGGEENVEIEEVEFTAEVQKIDTSFWRVGAVDPNQVDFRAAPHRDLELGTVLADGTALSRPILIPGLTLSGRRSKVLEYTILPGDSLGLIGYTFDVSVSTIMWENGLTLRSIIQPGDVLKVPPTDGVMHTIKKGDTLKKIATLYDADMARIASFNRLSEDGTDLVVGERIMVPDGTRAPIAGVPSRANNTTLTKLARKVATPPASKASPGAAGFVWPSGVHLITQYYGLQHHAIDIAGPWQTPTYAAKAGVVEKSQCGWNSGYGCYIIIDHGGGIKTLYGHHSQLLVSPGDYVETGQTIGLMGKSGKVRGVTGIHVHFEVQVNGVRVNPLGYVK